MFPGYSVCRFVLIYASNQVTSKFLAQLVNSQKDVADDFMAVDDTGPPSTSAAPQRRFKRPRPSQRNTVPEILETPTSAMKKLRFSPEKLLGRSASPSKPGGAYFASVVTDSEEEEGEIIRDPPGELRLMLFLQSKGVRA